VQCAALETATHHVVKHGMKRNFPQVFIFETADGRITRIQAYEPYGLHGIVGVFLALARLKNRVLRQ
jgi:ketosteroid isomerase-like protein